MLRCMYWWLSFVDNERPKGQKLLGVVITQGDSMVDAVVNCLKLKINPGGEVAGTGFECSHNLSPFLNRLLAKEETTYLATLPPEEWFKTITPTHTVIQKCSNSCSFAPMSNI